MPSSSGRRRRTTAPSGSSTSRSSRTWTCFPTNTLAEAERWAADIGVPAYVLDDQTAIKVADGTVEVVSEGEWKLLS